MGIYIPWAVVGVCYQGVGGIERGGWVASRSEGQRGFLPTSTATPTERDTHSVKQQTHTPPQYSLVPGGSQTQVDCNSGWQMPATLVSLGCSPDIVHSPTGAPLLRILSVQSALQSWPLLYQVKPSLTLQDCRGARLRER